MRIDRWLELKRTKALCVGLAILFGAEQAACGAAAGPSPIAVLGLEHALKRVQVVQIVHLYDYFYGRSPTQRELQLVLNLLSVRLLMGYLADRLDARDSSIAVERTPSAGVALEERGAAGAPPQADASGTLSDPIPLFDSETSVVVEAMTRVCLPRLVSRDGVVQDCVATSRLELSRFARIPIEVTRRHAAEVARRANAIRAQQKGRTCAAMLNARPRMVAATKALLVSSRQSMGAVAAPTWLRTWRGSGRFGNQPTLVSVPGHGSGGIADALALLRRFAQADGTRIPQTPEPTDVPDAPAKAVVPVMQSVPGALRTGPSAPSGKKAFAHAPTMVALLPQLSESFQAEVALATAPRLGEIRHAAPRGPPGAVCPLRTPRWVALAARAKCVPRMLVISRLTYARRLSDRSGGWS